MNEPDDNPTSSSRPAPYGDPPQEPRPPAASAAPPAAPVEPSAPSDPPPPAAPAPAPAPTVAAADDLYEEDEFDDGPASRWVALLATIGTALIGIVTVQVLTSLVEGFALKSGQRVGIPDDLFHRIGYPFGGLGATALVFLVVGVVLVAMPSVLGELLPESQDRLVGIALVVAVAMGVIIAIGSLLAVRANLHEYSAKNVAVPSYVRVQFTNFLLGSLGAAALSLFASIATINERGRDRL